MRLKNIVQDMIDRGDLTVDGLKTNGDHGAFKNPLPNYNKDGASTSNDTCGARINHISAEDNQVNVITINDKCEHESVNVTTRAQKYVLKGHTSTTNTIPKIQYDLVSQLHKTPTQISIQELLKLSPKNKAILEQALLETNVPQDLDADKFQAMVAHMTGPHNLTFSEHDNISLSHPHNTPLHIEVLVYKHRVKRVLIDGGVGLNICTLKFIRALGLSKQSIYPCKKITIKAYDDEERSSKGTVMLPIQVGPIQKDTMCQVLDIDLTYNILLGRPWIHEMQAVPSTYH